MSSHKCTMERSLYSGWVNTALYICPEDYLWCEDVDEFMDAVHEDLYEHESKNVGNVHWKDSDCDTNIPKELIKEWKSLKGLK